jgi:hypothetical protein
MTKKIGSISKLLKGASEETAKAKKTSTPGNADHTSLADRNYVAKVAFEEAEANFRIVEAELLVVATQNYVENAHSNFSKSTNFLGSKTSGVQVTFTDRFSDLPVESEEGLREVLGDKYGNFFEESRKLELTKTDDSTIQLLIKKLGEETFLEIFKIKVSIKAKDDLDRKQFDLPESVRSQLKQAKPSVKLLKE